MDLALLVLLVTFIDKKKNNVLLPGQLLNRNDFYIKFNLFILMNKHKQSKN
jgi:hypothetical protein